LNGSDSWANGFTATFQTVFSADCPQGPATLDMSADNVFNAYLNGVFVGNGTSFNTNYNFPITLQCGCNSLVVVAENLDAGSPASLIFSITQNQSSCYQCNDCQVAVYNRDTCMCQCTNMCSSCDDGKIFKEYPICGCVCQNVLTCNDNQYWNGLNCSCTCKTVTCSLLTVLNSTTCACDSIIGVVLNSATGLVSDLDSTVDNVVSGVTSTADNAVQAVTSTVGSVLTNATSSLTSTLGDLLGGLR